MKIYTKLEEITDMPDTSVALGNFDGVHLGHQAIIKEAVSTARKKTSQGIPEKAAVFTFSTHPKNLIPGAKHVENIIYSDEKRDLIESLGVDYYIDIEFNEDIMTMEPADYVRDLLLEKFHAKDVFCGFNYRFGYKAAGNTETLRRLGEEYGFRLHEMPPVMVDGEVVSSTLIRELIRSGDIDECDRFLGRNYTIGGEVVVGNKLGKSIGFPTSNIMIDETMVTPPNGVYITYLVYNGVRYPSITNVGVKPTVGAFRKNIETHVFNFDKELYGKFIKIEFIRMTRPEAKFASIEDLKAQIAKDCHDARAFHGI